MASTRLSTFGKGFLPTDPRGASGGSGPTGGSEKASQYQDTYSLESGEGGFGFASPKARVPMVSKPQVAPPPNRWNTLLTEEERTDLKESKGVATTHANTALEALDPMRNLAQEKQTRSQKVIGTREADEYKRTILDPAANEAAKFRAQALAAKDMFGGSDLRQTLANTRARYALSPGAPSGRQSGGYSMPSEGGGLNSEQGRNAFTEGMRVTQPVSYSDKQRQWYLEDKKIRDLNRDPTALRSRKVHSETPGVQAKDWAAMAHAQSAGGRAGAGEMANAAFSAHYREDPNK